MVAQIIQNVILLYGINPREKNAKNVAPY